MTRQSLAILLLSIYAVVLFKPLFPIMEYAMNKEYIAKNLCVNRNKPKSHCNGKCHLMKQLKKQASGIETQSGGNGQKNIQEQEENIMYVGSEFTAALANSLTQDHKFYIRESGFLLSDHTEGVFRPPCKA